VIGLSAGTAVHAANQLGYDRAATYGAAAALVGGVLANTLSDHPAARMAMSAGIGAGAAQLSAKAAKTLLKWTGAQPEQSSHTQDSAFDDDLDRDFDQHFRHAHVGANGAALPSQPAG